MIFYTDGSMVHDHSRPQQGQKMSCGIAVIVVDGDDMLQHSRRLIATNGEHEALAFVEACRLAHEAGVDPIDAAFYTDCDVLGYAGVFLHRDNYNARRASAISRIENACRLLQLGDFAGIAISYGLGSRINKVKSHQMSTPVYHRRADYIAYCAARGTEPKPFDEWLAEGFFFPKGTHADGTLYGITQYAPFTGVVEQGMMIAI